MEVGAVLVLGSASDDADAADNSAVFAQPIPAASFSDTPVVMLEVLGEPILYRIIESLHRSGLGPIFLLANQALANHGLIRNIGRSRVHVIAAPKDGLGTSTQTALTVCKERGLRTAVVMRVATYVELDVADMVRFHRANGQSITFARDCVGRLEMAMIDCVAPDKAMAFVNRGWACRPDALDYTHGCYANRLCTPKDLRRLAQDALLQRCRIQPNALQVRRGVWIAESAHLHPQTRVVGPAYIGADVRLRSGVLITRSTSIERDCEVDCGCVVENASILPCTYLGVGLMIAHAIVDRNRLIDLRRTIEVEVGDHGLIGPTSFPGTTLGRALVRSISPGVRRSVSQSWAERLRNLWPARPAPVPALEHFSCGANESWPMFDKLPGAVNPGSI